MKELKEIKEDIKNLNQVTQEFIIYWFEYLKDNDETYNDYYEGGEVGDFVCKYSDDQDQVNLVLDELDEYFDN